MPFRKLGRALGFCHRSRDLRNRTNRKDAEAESEKSFLGVAIDWEWPLPGKLGVKFCPSCVAGGGVAKTLVASSRKASNASVSGC